MVQLWTLFTIRQQRVNGVQICSNPQEADLALREFQQGMTVGKVVLDVGDKVYKEQHRYRHLATNVVSFFKLEIARIASEKMNKSVNSRDFGLVK